MPRRLPDPTALSTMAFPAWHEWRPELVATNPSRWKHRLGCLSGRAKAICQLQEMWTSQIPGRLRTRAMGKCSQEPPCHVHAVQTRSPYRMIAALLEASLHVFLPACTDICTCWNAVQGQSHLHLLTSGSVGAKAGQSRSDSKTWSGAGRWEERRDGDGALLLSAKNCGVEAQAAGISFRATWIAT